MMRGATKRRHRQMGTIVADTLARQLARFAAGPRFDDLPTAVLDEAMACIVHCICVGLAQHGSPIAPATGAAPR